MPVIIQKVNVGFTLNNIHANERTCQFLGDNRGLLHREKAVTDNTCLYNQFIVGLDLFNGI